MNRYPLWKNLLICAILLIALVYTAPNFFKQVPVVQITSSKTSVEIDAGQAIALSEEALKKHNIAYDRAEKMATGGARIFFNDTDIQQKGKDVIEAALNPDSDNPGYITALNLVSSAPSFLTSIHALPMYLGLDLRGGVHFLLEVDMDGAITTRLDSTASEMRTQLRSSRLRHTGINRVGQKIEIRFHDTEQMDEARSVLRKNNGDLLFTDRMDNGTPVLIASMNEQAQLQIREFAIKQNINTLHKRIDELGVAEPVIQQQGLDRIIVQLPGVQDVNKAKDLLGRTATLEIHLLDETPGALEAALAGNPPFTSELYTDRSSGLPMLLYKQVILTGERLTNAQPGFDRNNMPSVNLTLDSTGARIFRDVTRENINKRMAIVLIEQGKAEVVTAPVIRSEIGGGRVEISGAMTVPEANETALLLRSGSLAAPMKIIEERTLGPKLGADNISKGFHSTLWGFMALSVFMIIYYTVFGTFSVIALTCNLMLLIALLSMLQATLTLPGIAAIALTLGMAIDANVLINERIREELRLGMSPQAAISAGYDRAFDTILDANITTLIAGIALLVFGSGPIRGFAVVHCLGVLTSMFTSIMVSRMLVNFVYGRRRKLQKVHIG